MKRLEIRVREDFAVRMGSEAIEEKAFSAIGEEEILRGRNTKSEKSAWCGADSKEYRPYMREYTACVTVCQ
jgi:hypothetical protein